MADAPRPNVPAPLDRTAVERVLARAAELQAASTDPAEALSEAQLLEIAREVGLSPDHVRRAIAEERARVTLPHETGLAARIAGPARAAASRVVMGRPAEVLAALGRALENDEAFQVCRRLPERVVFEPRRDLVGSLRRGLGMGGRPALRAASEITVSVYEVDDSRVFVQIEADVSQSRRQRLAAGTATAVASVLAGGVVLGLGAVAGVMPELMVPTALLPAAAGSGGGWVIARAHRAVVSRAQMALEHLLDRLEQGELRAPPPARRPGLLDVIDEVRRALG